ncbi:hypothetical protein RHO14_02615 [Orbus wheelerorum]|uniref:RCC1 domain-containing protein n=1 Tax=Orbus wheelerorum TaxID=3074111 RepID=UPI00370D3F58
MIPKFISFLLINLFIPFVYAQTDAVLLSTKVSGGGGSMTRLHAVDTGAIIENGDVWVWGYRDGGLSGNGKTLVIEWEPPERVSTFVNKRLDIVQVTGGIYHIIVLDMNGDVWGWGQNGYRQASAGQCASGPVKTPCLILQGKNVIQIGAGEYTGYALTKNGEVYAWGHGIYGQIGNGRKDSSNSLYKIPQSYFNNKKIVMLGAAYEGGYAINEVGEIFGWGDEQANSFGYNTYPAYHSYVVTPKKLNISIDGQNITHICGGEGYTQYLTTDGDVYGIGELSRIGQGALYSDTTHRTAYPVKILTNVRTLYCRYAGSAAIKNTNYIYTWGSNLSPDPFFIYGSVPIGRKINGNLIRIDGGKENLYYLNDQGQYYGVGYGAGHKFDHSSNRNIPWPGTRLTFLEQAVKAVYGQDYVLGQGN